MKNFCLFILSLFLIFNSGILANESQTDLLSNGIGAEVNFTSPGQTTLFIPIVLSPKLMLEIELASVSSTSDQTSPNSYGGEWRQTSTSESTVLGLGLLKRNINQNINQYYGFRFGLLTVKYKYETEETFNGSYTSYYGSSMRSTSELSGLGTFVAPVFGIEFFIISGFSFTGEAQYHVSNIKTDGDVETSNYSSTISGENKLDTDKRTTRFLFIFRWYY